MTLIYHPGELEVQARAGVRDMASRVGKSIRSTIPLAAQEFLRSQPMAVVGTLDADGRMWASLLAGAPGFMQAVDEQTVRINARPAPGDPLNGNLKVNDQMGMIVIEFATRRRMRLNGRAEMQSDGAIYIHPRQVYSNCPKYIQAREWGLKSGGLGATQSVRHDPRLTERHWRWIREADTFFIASNHPEVGADASHRGGNGGFVRVLNEHLLVWPDYSGNMMFQTLGNIAVNPHVGLLFINFDGGSTLQLTGKARIIWDPERVKEFAGAERIVEFQIDEVVEIAGVDALRWEFISASSFNPVG